MPTSPTTVRIGNGSAGGRVGHSMIESTDLSFGPESRNRLEETGDPSVKGAEAALESFYYALNNRDLNALRADWSSSPLTQLNNPVGGILRGTDRIAELYARVFSGSLNVQVTFHDVIAYVGERHAVFAGRESGISATKRAAGANTTTTAASTTRTR